MEPLSCTSRLVKVPPVGTGTSGEMKVKFPPKVTLRVPFSRLPDTGMLIPNDVAVAGRIVGVPSVRLTTSLYVTVLLL